MSDLPRRGHYTTDPCAICDGHDNNQVDSWFCYTTCDAHAHVPPAHQQTAREKYFADLLTE